MSEEAERIAKECGYRLPGWAFDPMCSTSCRLPDGHDSEHVSYTSEYGDIVWLQPDPSCDCADCLGLSDDPQDACVAWSYVEEQLS